MTDRSVQVADVPKEGEMMGLRVLLWNSGEGVDNDKYIEGCSQTCAV